MRAVGDNLEVRTFRGAWSLAGLVAGAAGLATSYFVAMAMTLGESPVVSVANLVIRLTPGWLAHYLIEQVGSLDKPLLLLGIFVVLGLIFAWAGRLARRVWWAPTIVYGALAMVGGIAVSAQRGSSSVDLVPVAVGFVTWLVALSLLTEPLHRLDVAVEHVPAPHEIDVLEPAPPGTTPGAASSFGSGSSRPAPWFWVPPGAWSAAAAATWRSPRRLLRLTDVTEPRVPKTARIGLEGVTPWQTSNSSFYRIDTAIVVPAIEPTSGRSGSMARWTGRSRSPSPTWWPAS